MSGTAKTSEEEFYKVYTLPVATIPTHKKIKREDRSDLIFQTEKENSMLSKEVKALYEKVNLF